MAADHTATQLALRGRLLTLSVLTTGSTTLSATSTGYARTAGSFITDGFAVGMEVTPSGFTQTAVGVVTGVSALALEIDGGRDVEAAGAGRSLTVGLPSRMGWDNTRLEPTAAAPYGEEEYVPATARTITMPASGADMEATGLYVLRLYGKAEPGISALRKLADAILALFAPGTGLTVGSATVRVRTDLAPWAGAIRADRPGWSVVVLTIPWRLAYLNT